jgi:hypothetical protein
MAHPIGIAGLIINTLSAIGLLTFTRYPDAGSPLTHEQLQSVRTPAQRRQYVLRVWGYRGSLIALAVGFGLQLVDLLIN